MWDGSVLSSICLSCHLQSLVLYDDGRMSRLIRGIAAPDAVSSRNNILSSLILLFFLFYRWMRCCPQQTDGKFGRLQDLKQTCGIGGLRVVVLFSWSAKFEGSG